MAPRDDREWIFLSSGEDMVYGPMETTFVQI